MAISKPRMHLALDVSWTQVETDWRQPTSWVNRFYPDIGLFEDIARICERGLFDLIFSQGQGAIANCEPKLCGRIAVHQIILRGARELSEPTFYPRS